MITLVFVTCMVASPIDCRKRELPIYEDISSMACMMGAQGELARWRDGHPGWRITEWKCQTDRLAQSSK